MSRPIKQLRKKFAVFCEGDTEYSYIDKMRKNQGVEISIELINMKGGGYANFLGVIKTKSKTNCLAKFIVIDADRIQGDEGEKVGFLELLEYCSRQNKLGAIPHFLIINQPDFEYVACLHSKEYKGQDITKFITSVWKFKGIEELKGKKDIYDFLNSNNKSYVYAMTQLKKKAKFLKNIYSVNRRNFAVQIKETVLEWDNLILKGSNIEEFFDVIDW